MPATVTTVAAFKVGHRYVGRFTTDWNSKVVFEVIKRTKCFITFYDAVMNKEYRVKVRTNEDGSEWALPHGTYSMAMVLRATREA